MAYVVAALHSYGPKDEKKRMHATARAGEKIQKKTQKKTLGNPQKKMQKTRWRVYMDLRGSVPTGAPRALLRGHNYMGHDCGPSLTGLHYMGP